MAYFLYFHKRPSVRVSCLRRTFINQPYYRMKRYLNLLFLAAAALCASCARDAVVSDVPPKGEDVGGYDNNVIVPGWVRIRLDDEAAPLRTGVFTRGEADSGNPLLDELAAGLGATEIREVFPTDPRFEERHRKYGLHLWFDIRLGDEVPVSRAEQEFAALPGVRHAQPIYRIVALDGADYPLPSEVSEPSSWEGSSREMPFNDPGLKMQWHYDNDGTMTNAEGETVAVEGADIGLFEAWEMYGAGDPSVIVAVMDTGVFSGHEDLQGNMWVNEAELNGTAGKDDDGNGMPVVKYRLEYAEKSGGNTGEWQTMDLVNTADAGEDYEYRMMLVQLTTYAFRMTPVDRFGNEGSTVEFEATTLQHTNRPPRQKANFLDVEAAKAGEKYSKKFKLAYYFIEPDEAFGDALTFTVTSSDEDVVSVVMTNGSDLELVPLKQGESTITVRATDKGGLYVESSFKFTVLENAFENIKPRATKEFGTVRMAGTGAEYRQSFVLSEYFTDANLADGDVLTFSFTNTNEAVVGVTVEEGSLVVEPIAEGTASVTVTATDLAGESAQSVLTVQVGSVPAGDGGLLIAPNPVGETLSMHFAAAAGVGAEAVIYDAAARRVLSENVEFDGNGTGTLDVSALTPGIYTLSVKTEGGIAGNGTFVKR